jgi:hypothetical protein
MLFGWCKSENRERLTKLRLDREHLEARSRRFLNSYLKADEMRKARFYRIVDEASQHCHSTGSGLPPPDLQDADIAEATSAAAMKIVLERTGSDRNDRAADFVTDAYATVAIAYHRAAGIYLKDKDMMELGTAAVHLLTMATSYIQAHKE